MNRIKGPILLFVFIVLLIATGYWGRQFFLESRESNTSDTKGIKRSFEWAGDGYLGYAFLQTREIKKQLARSGLSLRFNNDNGDYQDRLKRFAKKEYDFIVLPINSYLEHGINHDFPGVIVSAIAESKGADAILGFDDVLPTGKVNDLNDPSLNIYYTPASPSSFLLDLTITDFDLDELENNSSWRKEANGSEEVYEMARKSARDRALGDVFVMWEPEVSKAVNELGMQKLWGSDKFSGYIIDVFVFHRDVIARDEKYVLEFLKTYFRTLDYYNSRQDEMKKEFSRITDLRSKYIDNMIDNIDWFSLEENCAKMFDLPLEIGLPSNEGVINSIYACSDVLLQNRIINEDIDDPYKIVNSGFLETIKEDRVKRVGSTNEAGTIEFTALSLEQWNNLSDVGTLRIEPITFQSVTRSLDYKGEEIVDEVAGMLVNNYPSYRIKIKGHTGSGDQSANQILSQERADIVKQRLIGVHGIDPNRLFAEGTGSLEPPRKKAGENPRAYILRWARVEFILVQDNSI
ncbi:MAG: phosphate ABC transporter substrate-binding/OmpA family protein [Bacteroidota bacterium]